MPTAVLRVSTLNDTVVVTASRTRTTLADAPATLSVIGRVALENTPVQDLADVLRTVPGVNVARLSARDVSVTTREPPSTLANSLLVLVDDRPVVEDFFGVVLWDFLPTSMGDVEQLEVVRGPASAVWGGSALGGVLNIVTKSPREAPGTTVSLSAGGFSRETGSTVGRGLGALASANATVARVLNARWAYRVSGGFFEILATAAAHWRCAGNPQS